MSTHSLSTFGAILASCAVLAHAEPKQSQELNAVLNRKPDLVRGEAVYQPCAACHGGQGQGSSDGQAPVIAGQHFAVLAKQIVDFRHDARLEVRMQHFASSDHLERPQQIADVAAYISRMKPVTASTPQAPDEAGRVLYFDECVLCHGWSGEGKSDWFVPRLAGQHYEYLVRQVQDIGRGARPNVSQEHAKSLSRLDEEGIASLARYLASLSP